ncbi:helix-turn-helix domain-containing protein [Mesotoga sp.]|uniref:helix-turn-helix domain-containing protein n=1 Tax=Mesotoga sp. TaxID=2053577 RepID=UPI001BD43F0D|nr:helix-turn-helix domain-containing protein [Mesotoga sp.]
MEIVEMNGRKYYETKEVAEIFDCTPWTIRKWINEGTLRASRIGKRYLVDEWTIQKKLDWNAKGGDEEQLSTARETQKTTQISEEMRSGFRTVRFEELPEGKYAVINDEGIRIGTLIREQN